MMTNIDRDRMKVLWQIIEEARRERPNLRDFTGLVRHLRERGEQLTVSELIQLQRMFAVDYGQFTVPNSVAQFFDLLLQSKSGGNLLDPFGGFGLLGAYLAENNNERRIEIVTNIADAKEMIQPLNLKNVILNIGTTQAIAETIGDHYDAIVSVPPIGRKNEKRSFLADNSQVDLTDDPSLLSIVDYAPLLSDKGFFAIVVAPRFALEKRRNSVRQNLNRFGLYIHALLKFPAGTFAETGLSLDLAIIARKPRKKLYVAEVPEDIKGQIGLIDRLKNGKQGLTPTLGRLIPHDQFCGLAVLEAREQYDNLMKRKAGLKRVPLRRAVTQISAPKLSDPNSKRYDEHVSAVYLPEIGTAKATIEIPEKAESYLQLLVDPSVVLPEYLAGIFNNNTPVSHYLRQSVMMGTTVPRINRDLLMKSRLYLPTIEEQQQGLRALHEIQNLRSWLFEQETKLWELPRESSSVLEAVDYRNNERRFLDWINTLPFPLASILHSYHAIDQSPNKKYERLLDFFEAFSLFCATIHLSAMHSSPVHWESLKDEIKSINPKKGLSLEVATFGDWRAIFEFMARNLRKMLDNDEQGSLACELYSTRDVTPLKILASKELNEPLREANTLRNEWDSHGGDVTPDEASNVLAKLKTHLTKIQRILGNIFLQYQLIQPVDCEIFEGPIYRCRIRRAMGSNPPQVVPYTIDLITEVNAKSLYLHNPGNHKALKLLPFVQLVDMAQSSGFFFSRVKDKQPFFVAYQSALQSRMPIDDPSLIELLREFKT